MNIIKFLLLWILCSCASTRGEDNSELVSVVQIFRSGQRTPLYSFPTDRYGSQKFWPAAPGELVNEGKLQMYSLGSFTRARYEGFLPKKYHKKDFTAYTTDVDRAHMSAQCYMAGLYPPDGQQIWNPELKWQPIPLHLAEENILQYHCNAYWYLVNYTLIYEPFFQQTYRMYELYFNSIGKTSGTNIRTTLQAHKIYDTLFIEELNGYNISGWEHDYPYPLSHISAYGLSALSFTDRLKKISTGFFWHYLIDHFENMLSENPSRSKLKVYSGHASNIVAILQVLQKYSVNDHNPQFGSSIYFELWRRNGKGFVDVWYKQGDNITKVNVYGCNKDCTLNQFKERMKDYTIDTEEQYAGLCERSDNGLI